MKPGRIILQKIKSFLLPIKRCFSLLGEKLTSHPFVFVFTEGIILNFLIECMGRHSLTEGIIHIWDSPAVFLYNAFIIGFVLSFCVFFRKRIFMNSLLATLWFAAGLVNCILLTFGINPLRAIDIYIALNHSLFLMYLTPFQQILFFAGIALFFIGMAALWIVSPKIKGNMNYGKKSIAVSGILMAVVLFTVLARNFGVISKDFSNLTKAYDEYGFVYCFTNSVLDSGIDEPEQYSKESVETLLKNFPKTEISDGTKPDIVLIQLESFVDAKNFKGMTFSDEPAPVFTYLKENYSSGYLEVPAFGGGTANTEFEVLTGMNLDHFAAAEYPYSTVLREKACESLAFNLKENGYSTHAIHNHTGSFYDRDEVYPHMGFDSFQSREYMYDYETTAYDWCKDAALTEEIMTALTYTDEKNNIASDTPRFVWTVSVQGHGAYPKEPIEGEVPVIKIESDLYSEEELCSLEYYINQLWEMDMFLGNLIEALEERGKPVLLVAYGDHYPSLKIAPENLKSGNIYKTEYVVWNNFGLEELDCDLTSYQLGAQIMNCLGYNNGNITKLHQYRNHSVPSLSDEEYQKSLRYLSYDMLYGSHYQFGGENPYKKTNMRMGTLPITVDDIVVAEDNIYVKGKGFTQMSRIFINGKEQETVLYSQSSLMAGKIIIKQGDSVCVGQVSEDEVMSYSNAVVYKEEEHRLAGTAEGSTVKPNRI